MHFHNPPLNSEVFWYSLWRTLRWPQHEWGAGLMVLFLIPGINCKIYQLFPRIMFFYMISFPSLLVYSNLDPPLTLQGLDFDEERKELSVPPALPSAQRSPPWALCSLVSPLGRIRFCFFVFVCLHLCVELMFCRSHGCAILYPCKSRLCRQIAIIQKRSKPCFNGKLTLFAGVLLIAVAPMFESFSVGNNNIRRQRNRRTIRWTDRKMIWLHYQWNLLQKFFI